MTMLQDVAAPPRARLVSRPLLVRFVSVVGTATSFYLLLSTVPLYARSTGASAGLAGLTTTALTLSSVAAYPVTPRLMARYGTRAVLAGGLLALGLPALALAFSDRIALILAALAGLGSLPWLPASRAATGTTKADGMVAVLRNPALVRPAAVFSATTMAIGIIVTFLPLAVARTDAGVAALALLVQPAAAIAGRWLAGRRGDRRGPAALLVPGVVAATAGMLALSLTAVPAAVIAGAAVFGLGFGVTQNVTQTLMYDRVPESAYGAASALWNLAYDGGMGLGAAGFGVLALHTGYPIAFALTAAILPAMLLAVGRTRAAARSA